jgi:pimeloyl-ACP methyl ester carboxylesterase
MDLKPVKLAYEEYGQGTPLVLVHGFPLNRTIWKPLIPMLEGHVRVIVPDLRGFGESPVTDGVYAMRLLAEDLALLLDDLHIERAILAGQSMGGYVCLAFALAYPARLAGLGLVASQARADTFERKQSRYNMAEDVGRKGMRVVADYMGPKLTKDQTLMCSLKSLMLKTNPKAVIGALKGMAERPDMTEQLSTINVPGLVVAGADDVVIPIDRAETMAQLLPRGWMVTIPGAGHMPMMEAPTPTAEALLQLVKSVGKF